MKQLRNFGIATILAIVALISCSKQEAEPVPDYILNRNIYLPGENGDSVAIADPHVIKVGDEWFLYGTGYSG